MDFNKPADFYGFGGLFGGITKQLIFG